MYTKYCGSIIFLSITFLLPPFREYLAQKASQVTLEVQERKADKAPEVSLEYQEMMDHP